MAVCKRCADEEKEEDRIPFWALPIVVPIGIAVAIVISLAEIICSE